MPISHSPCRRRYIGPLPSCSDTFRGDDRRLLKCQSELNASGLTLGELLKKKAESGVRVLIMIWGETTSIMGTHDTETENYFKGWDVAYSLGRQLV